MLAYIAMHVHVYCLWLAVTDDETFTQTPVKINLLKILYQSMYEFDV